MTIDSQQKTSKFRWGEMDEDDDLDFLLPPKQVIGPDENGLKTTIEYKFNDEGNKVKITTRTRVRKLASARLNKRAMERRNWAKFGDAANEEAGSHLTMVSTEEILLERPRAPGILLISDDDDSGDCCLLRFVGLWLRIEFGFKIQCAMINDSPLKMLFVICFDLGRYLIPLFDYGRCTDSLVLLFSLRFIGVR